MSLLNPFKRKKPDSPEAATPAGAAAPSSAEAPTEPRNGLFGRLRSSLARTRQKVTGSLLSVLAIRRPLDEAVIEEIEEQLYVADVGPKTVARLCRELRAAHKEGRVTQSNQVAEFLAGLIKDELRRWDTELRLPETGPAVLMVVGVNGSGKTTSIAKLAQRFVRQGRRVLLAASDTFRAAAVEQLCIWAERVGADIVKNESADPAAVAFDAAEKALAGGYDVLIIDTAGRLHTRSNLMMELEKVRRVVAGKVPGAPHETLLVLDATTGQNAVSQALRFNEHIPLTGLVLAKLDGTAKGGIVFGMRDQIDLPVKFIGIGERADDLVPFDADRFVDALFE
ncbi:MAG: signal recognition particle-docking protein FtsY [Candidatus Brocadiaceae bacterium]|nr:signal recognition particle-docking protein FtsY [Candidatus Brocadiaceae bacterium]